MRTWSLVLVAISVAALFFTWQTSQKNGRLSVEMEKQTREHQMFADRFSAITDVEAEVKGCQRAACYSEDNALSFREAMSGRAYCAGG